MQELGMWMSGQAERNQLMVRGGSWRDTVIGEHTKIDNLVQVLHHFLVSNSRCPSCRSALSCKAFSHWRYKPKLDGNLPLGLHPLSQS